MYKLNIKIVFSCMTYAFQLVISNSVSHKFVNRQNIKLRQEYVESDVSGLSKLQCAAICENDIAVVNCLSISWEASSGLCQVSSYEAFNMDHIESVEGWITLVKVKYPVFLMYKNHLRNYSLTYAQGEAKCATYGASVASSTDMLEARSMGMHECSCGFLSDGTIGFVLQSALPACLDVFTDQVIICYWEMPTADVWCRFPW